MLDKEFWEAALEAHLRNSKLFHTRLTCSAPSAHLHVEDMDDAHYWEAWKPFDMANRKFVFYRDWVNVGWFLHMNPMAGMFVWTSLAADALEEAAEGLTRHTGMSLFRLYVHSRGR